MKTLRLAPALLMLTALTASCPALGDEPVADPRSALDAALEDPAVAPLASDSSHKLQLSVAVLSGGELTEATFGDPDVYFYPASTIKLFAAVAALLEIQELNERGVEVSMHTPLTIGPLREGDEPRSSDASNVETGQITIAHEIRKLFLVSDNPAFNTLYDIVGHERLNTLMWDAGLDSVRLTHRLSVARSPEENRTAPWIEFDLGEGTLRIERRVSQLRLDNTHRTELLVGDAVASRGEVTPGPKDFTYSNSVSLEDLRDAVLMIAEPEADLGKPGFGLSEEHRAFLLEAMTQLPRESANPNYDPEKYSDDWVKFTLPGVRAARPERDMAIANKVGLAYGFTSDTSFIFDRATGEGFFFAGVVYTNSNGVLNDNVYDYETKAFPMWEALGRVLTEKLLP